MNRFIHCLYFFIGVYLVCGVASAQEDWMPDANLRQAVREKLNLPKNTPLTTLHLERLYDLVILESGIADLQGLEHAVNFHFLHLSNSRIANLTPLAELRSLKTLKLYSNNISDITPLARLISLQELALEGNKISDITPLSNLIALKHLHLHNNQITDLTPLANLTNLEELSIAGNPITDFSPLANFPHFVHLVPIFIKIPDPILERAIREKLGLPVEIPLTDVEMQRLWDLVVLESDIANLEGLEHAANLRFLHLSHSRIVDLTPLTNLVSLEVLKLYDNGISDITPLANLRKLKELNLSGNQITDFTPLLGLRNLEVLHVQNNLGDVTPLLTLNLAGSQVCDVEGSPIAPRIANRDYPSVFAAWANIINLPMLSESERLARHDLYFCCPMFGLSFVETKEGIKLVGDIEGAMEQRRKLQAQNPNMVLLAAVRYFSGVNGNDYPEDWPIWLRDENGNRVTEAGWGESLLDFTLLETQEWTIGQVVAVSKCGLFDGIFLDHWSEHPRLSGYRSLEEEHTARDKILQGIRAEVDDDFLIMVNTNREKIPKWAAYVNGTFMETLPSISTDLNIFQGRGYTYTDLFQIESTLLWSEGNMREPRINGLEGWGLIEKLPDSPENQKWMRLFTTMSLTHSDGYVLYTIGSGSRQHEHPWDNEFLAQTYGHANQVPHVHDHDHYWYDFWDADLGQPIGEKAQLYENRGGLFIREFTNGWAVYNRSGKAQEIRLPEQATGVESGLQNTTHTVPDLDGEIYLKSTTDRHDVNGDGIVNILDLVAVANGFGKDTPDVNGDGTVNILDLVAVANAFGQ